MRFIVAIFPDTRQWLWRDYDTTHKLIHSTGP